MNGMMHSYLTFLNTAAPLYPAKPHDNLSAVLRFLEQAFKAIGILIWGSTGSEFKAFGK